MHNSLTPRYLVILVILGWSMFSLWPTIQYQSLTDDEKEKYTKLNSDDKIKYNDEMQKYKMGDED